MSPETKLLISMGKLDRFAFDLIQCEIQKEHYQELSRQAIQAGADDLHQLTYANFVTRAAEDSRRRRPSDHGTQVVRGVPVGAINGRDHHLALEAASEQLRNLKAVVDQIYLAIITHLHQAYGVPLESRSSEKNLANIDPKIFDFPKGVRGKPDPVVADKLMQALTALLHSHVRQCWAIIPVFHRLFEDDEGVTRWQPTAVEFLQNAGGMLETFHNLYGYYVSQNCAVYDLLSERDYPTMQSTHEQMRTTATDDSLVIINKSSKGDGASSVSWLVARHYQFGFASRDKLLDLFNYMSALFVDGSIVAAVKKVRTYLPMARQLKLRLVYHRTIGKCALIIQQRHNSYTIEMSFWVRCPSGVDPHNCMGAMDEWLSIVENQAIELGDKLPAAHVRDNANSRAAFANFAKSINVSGGDGGRGGGGGGRDGGRGKGKGKGKGGRGGDRKGSEPSDTKCAACNNCLPKGMLEALKGVINMICSECFKKMNRPPYELKLKDGTVRRPTNTRGKMHGDTRAMLVWSDSLKKPYYNISLETLTANLVTVRTEKATARRAATAAAAPEPAEMPVQRAFSAAAAPAAATAPPQGGVHLTNEQFSRLLNGNAPAPASAQRADASGGAPPFVGAYDAAREWSQTFGRGATAHELPAGSNLPPVRCAACERQNPGQHGLAKCSICCTDGDGPCVTVPQRKPGHLGLQHRLRGGGGFNANSMINFTVIPTAKFNSAVGRSSTTRVINLKTEHTSYGVTAWRKLAMLVFFLVALPCMLCMVVPHLLRGSPPAVREHHGPLVYEWSTARPAFAHDTSEHPHLLDHASRSLKLDNATSFLAKASKIDSTINSSDWKYVELCVDSGCTRRLSGVQFEPYMHWSRPSRVVCQGYAGAEKRFGRMHGNVTMHFFTVRPDAKVKSARHSFEWDSLPGMNSNLFGFSDLWEQGWNPNFGHNDMCLEPPSGKGPALPVEYFPEGKTFILRAIIAKDPHVGAAITKQVLERSDNGEDWATGLRLALPHAGLAANGFSSCELGGAARGVGATDASSEPTGTDWTDVDARLCMQFSAPTAASTSGPWVNPVVKVFTTGKATPHRAHRRHVQRYVLRRHLLRLLPPTCSRSWRASCGEGQRPRRHLRQSATEARGCAARRRRSDQTSRSARARPRARGSRQD